MALVVTGAQVQDSQTAAVAHLFVRLRKMLQRARDRLGRWPKLSQVFGDKNYRGTAAVNTYAYSVTIAPTIAASAIECQNR